MSLRTPLARARGLGSAKEGVNHWWAQRITAVMLIPLWLWFVISLLSVARADYAVVIAWIGHPINTALLVVLLLGTFYHAILGIQVVIEDYVHHEMTKLIALVLTQLGLIVLATTAIVAVLRIAFLSELRIVSGG